MPYITVGEENSGPIERYYENWTRCELAQSS
jgi:hypothetical protein